MKKFEVGNRYYESSLTYEITGRTAKTVIESMVHTANEYHMVQEMFKGYIEE